MPPSGASSPPALLEALEPRVLLSAGVVIS